MRSNALVKAGSEAASGPESSASSLVDHRHPRRIVGDLKAHSIRVLHEERNGAAKVLNVRNLEAGVLHGRADCMNLICGRGSKSEMVHARAVTLVWRSAGLGLQELKEEAATIRPDVIPGLGKADQRHQLIVVRHASVERRNQQCDVVDFHVIRVMHLGLRGSPLPKYQTACRVARTADDRGFGLNELLGCTCLLVLQDVDEFSERVTDMEPAYSPRLACGAVLNGDLGVLDSSYRFIEVVNLYR